MKFTSMSLSLLAVTACTTGGGSGLAFEQRASEIEGIYRLDTHLMNDAACAPGGTPMGGEHGFAFAKRGSVFGTEFLQVWSCESLEDCRAKAAQDQLSAPIDFGFTLTGVDGDALTGFEATTGWTDGSNTCSMPELSDLVLELDGDALRIEKAIRVGADYTTSNGICTTDKGRASAEKATCSQMETLTATFVEAL
ncbi:MAG: hypothetical protein ACKV2T_31735 [Kofleriaceae bacterium]